MFKFRRSVAMYLVFMLGLFLGQVNDKLIFIIGVPILMALIMLWDEVTYKRKENHRAKRIRRV